MFEKKKNVDIGQDHSNVELTVIVHRGEFMRLAELVLVERSIMGIDPIVEMSRMVKAIQFARQCLAGNWVMTDKNFIAKKDVIPKLDNKRATLEIDRDNATQLVLLKNAIDLGDSTKKHRGVEITFDSSFLDYIEYTGELFCFRDAAIEKSSDSGKS